MRARLDRTRSWVDDFVDLAPWLLTCVRRQFPQLEGEEIVQESYLRLLSAGAQPDVLDHKRYLARIARTVAIDSIRRAKTRSICQSLEISEIEHACPAPLPDRRLEAKLCLDRVEQALAALAETQRRVILLKRVEGAGSREVANLLGISISSVEKHLTSSIRALEVCRI
jgi:RNA polymerase sigma-70 factor (ECF subfamily)